VPRLYLTTGVSLPTTPKYIVSPTNSITTYDGNF
jgi:hypothetical protein